MIKLVNPWTRLGERNINYAAHRPVRWLLGRHKLQRVGWRDNTFQQQKNVSAAPSVFLFPCCAPSIPPSLSVLASVVISDGGTVGEPVNTRRSNKVSNSGFWFSSNRIFRIEICTRTRRNSTTPGEPNEMKTNSSKLFSSQNKYIYKGGMRSVLIIIASCLGSLATLTGSQKYRVYKVHTSFSSEWKTKTEKLQIKL